MLRTCSSRLHRDLSCIHNLSKLTTSRLSTSVSGKYDPDGCVDLSLDCSALQALQQLQISGSFKAGAGFLQLAQLKHLTHVWLSNSTSIGRSTDVILDELLHCLATERTGV